MKPLMIGIAGGTGSGKSTVARKIANQLPQASVAFVEMDAYYCDFSHLSVADRDTVNWDRPDAFDIDLLVQQLDALSRGEAIAMPSYDFSAHARRDETVRIEPADVVVLDGILLLCDKRIRDRCNIKVFVDADADLRVIRRIRRDMETRGRTLTSVLDQYETTVHPSHWHYVEPSKRYADIIVPHGGDNMIAIDMLVAHIRRELEARLAFRTPRHVASVHPA